MLRKIGIAFIVVATLSGFYLIYKVWPTNQGLPSITKVKEFTLESIYTEEYQINNDKIKLVAFFYMKCPDICPMTMSDLKILQNKLKDQGLFGSKVEIVAITLDPINDSKENLLQYADHFNVDQTGWYILRGSEKEIEAVARQFQMVYKKDENGFVTHGTNMYLVDTKNTIRSIHEMAIGDKNVNVEEILKNIELLLKES